MRVRTRHCLVAVVLILALTALMALGRESPAATAPELDRAMDLLIHPDGLLRDEGLTTVRRLGDQRAVPGLIDLMYFDVFLDSRLVAVLELLSGERHGHDWRQWVEWLETRKAIRPHAEYAGWKGRLLSLVDPRFAEFLPPAVKHRVRLEEVLWGGVRVDGIPALTNPRHVTPREATYLAPDELVLGLSVGGQHRAYPLRIMDWHEMANDVVAGTPLSIAY